MAACKTGLLNTVIAFLALVGSFSFGLMAQMVSERYS
jgi:hypothetical protein